MAEQRSFPCRRFSWGRRAERDLISTTGIWGCARLSGAQRQDKGGMDGATHRSTQPPGSGMAGAVPYGGADADALRATLFIRIVPV